MLLDLEGKREGGRGAADERETEKWMNERKEEMTDMGIGELKG